MDTLLFATNNRNKAKEVEEALQKNNFPIHVITNQDLTAPTTCVRNWYHIFS